MGGDQTKPAAPTGAVPNVVKTGAPMIAIWTEDDTVSPAGEVGIRLIFAAWANGYAIWSANVKEGGPPYLKGTISSEVLKNTMAGFKQRGVFASLRGSYFYAGAHLPYTVIYVSDGALTLLMKSWHEWFEGVPGVKVTSRGIIVGEAQSACDMQYEEPEEYKQLLSVWADVRREVTFIVPDKGLALDELPFTEWRTEGERLIVRWRGGNGQTKGDESNIDR